MQAYLITKDKITMYNVKKEDKTQLPVLFCMNALQTIIGQFILLCYNYLKKKICVAKSRPKWRQLSVGLYNSLVKTKSKSDVFSSNNNSSN